MRGYVRNVEQSIRKVPAGAHLIPGHGPLSTVKELKELKELKEFHAMLLETSGIVEKAIVAGKSLKQALDEGLPEKYKGWSSSGVTTARWIELLYQGLKKR